MTERGGPGGGLTEQVRKVLADADGPLTPGQVREALGRKWAYTTVMTVLSRMVAQGAARRQRVGVAFAYTAVQDAAERTARRMSRLLDDGVDRAAVLSRFIDVLSEADEKLLGDLLAAPGSAPGPRQ